MSGMGGQMGIDYSLKEKLEKEEIEKLKEQAAQELKKVGIERKENG